MNEDFLQFIWKYGLFNREEMISDSNEAVEIISLGEHNHNSGPDFLNARIKIGNTLWAGNVEIHLKSSDWFYHRHHEDPAYNNVILQVVYKNDRQAYRSNQGIIPTVEIKFGENLYQNYNSLLIKREWMRCRNNINKIDPVYLECWLNALVVERLQQKSDVILNVLKENKNNWEETFYIFLARGFGFNINALPFELLARSLPLLCIIRQRGNLIQIEALLFGQAGLLSEGLLFDDYFKMLQTEYMYLKKKYKLKPLNPGIWKFLRIRPVNFPTVRIAQFAALLNSLYPLFSVLMKCREPGEVFSLLEIKPSAYWEDHYNFAKKSNLRHKQLGKEAINIIIINTIIPFLFIYGRENGLKDTTIEWLGKIPPENNHIIRNWESLGITPPSSLHTQGLLQLTNNYCTKRKCLQCSIGVKIISGKNF